MKTIKLFMVVVAILHVNLNFGQDNMNKETRNLFMSDSKVTGWFVGTSGTFTGVNELNSWMPGFTGGVMIDRNIKIGLDVRSFSWHETWLEFDNILSEPCYLNGGYAGLYIEPSLHPDKIVHLSFPLTIGGGGAVYLSKEKYPETDENELDYSRKELDSSPFFVIEPGVSLELNVTGFMRIYTGVSYRWLAGLNLENTGKNAFNSPNLNIGIRFGKF